jgi:hypothetical protein
MNFAEGSACLTADNIQNEVANYSQLTEGAENAVPLHVEIVRNCVNKNTTTFLLALRAHQAQTLTG